VGHPRDDEPPGERRLSRSFAHPKHRKRLSRIFALLKNCACIQLPDSQREIARPWSHEQRDTDPEVSDVPNPGQSTTTP